ncbi:hypothetical protein ANCDUO_01607 [Ancylostoma duodenale]|uniref:ELMO armadillo-like helical domain-containing protein n=1 Tax=Ancylostoma duodenale TaxID=51022 RepID=A0A0C2H8T2_9BILA|nr:hypothetical protein ANCDUO_01607 [Ancylostoma duodenale]
MFGDLKHMRAVIHPKGEDGAVIVDELIGKWNANVVLEANGPMSAFVVIDKKIMMNLDGRALVEEGALWLLSGDVNEVIKHVVQELKLPPTESYGLIFEEPKAFLTPNNLNRISHGFMLTVTAAPSHYVARLHDAIMNRNNFDNVEWALTTLEAFSSVNSQTCLNLCLRSICSMLDLGVQGIGWSTASTILVIKLATLVTGRAKREDSNVVLIALRMIENLLNSDSPTIRLLVLEEVPAQSLIRHLEKSDERVALAALSLMNALHEKSDASAREQIIKHFASMPFRTAISGSVLREGRGRNAALLCQLVPLQRLLINENTKFLGMPATESDVDALLAREVVRTSASSEEQLKSWADQLLSSPLGKLAVDTFANYAEHHPEDLRISGYDPQLATLCL